MDTVRTPATPIYRAFNIQIRRELMKKALDRGSRFHPPQNSRSNLTDCQNGFLPPVNSFVLLQQKNIMQTIENDQTDLSFLNGSPVLNDINLWVKAARNRVYLDFAPSHANGCHCQCKSCSRW